MLICLHGRQPIRNYSPRRWQRVPPPSVTGNDLRLSSDPAFVAGFSFGRQAACAAGSIQRSPSKGQIRQRVDPPIWTGAAEDQPRRSKFCGQQGSVRKRRSTRHRRSRCQAICRTLTERRSRSRLAASKARASARATHIATHASCKPRASARPTGHINKD
jgi:hypothetical protein